MLQVNQEGLIDEDDYADSQQVGQQPSQPTAQQAEVAADSKACSKANHIKRRGATHVHQQAAKILNSQGPVDVKKQPEVVEVRCISPRWSSKCR
jgi:hypothetical protein